MTALESALAIVADLEARRAAVVARQDKATEDRKAVAYDALAAGDQVSATKLQLINNSAMTAATDLASVDAALAEARRRVADAERSEALAAERDAMRAVLPITERVRARAALLDELLKSAADQTTAFLADMAALRRAGFGHPDPGLVATNVRLAGQAAVLGSALETERVRPSQRRAFAQLAEGWTAPIDAAARAVLGDEARAA
jgi:hypothetical protein